MRTMKNYDPSIICTAGGTSGEEIKDLILRLIAKYAGEVESVIDVGCGKGDLLRRVRQCYPNAALTGVDYLAKPPDLTDVEWIVADLNKPLEISRRFNLVLCSEVIEHVENPRHLFRFLNGLLHEDGIIVLTTPNQMSIRSLMSLMFYGHFVAFRDECYPAHISALLKKDLLRMVGELQLCFRGLYYTDRGKLPKLPKLTWQAISFGLARGEAFSDNIALLATKRGPNDSQEIQAAF